MSDGQDLYDHAVALNKVQNFVRNSKDLQTICKTPDALSLTISQLDTNEKGWISASFDMEAAPNSHGFDGIGHKDYSGQDFSIHHDHVLEQTDHVVQVFLDNETVENLVAIPELVNEGLDTTLSPEDIALVERYAHSKADEDHLRDRQEAWMQMQNRLG